VFYDVGLLGRAFVLVKYALFVSFLCAL